MSDRHHIKAAEALVRTDPRAAQVHATLAVAEAILALFPEDLPAGKPEPPAHIRLYRDLADMGATGFEPNGDEPDEPAFKES